MAKTKKVEIWATFKGGKRPLKRYMETCRNREAAESSIEAMMNRIKNDLAIGYGYPSGVPTYSIEPAGTLEELGQIVYL